MYVKMYFKRNSYVIITLETKSILNFQINSQKKQGQGFFHVKHIIEKFKKLPNTYIFQKTIILSFVKRIIYLCLSNKTPHFFESETKKVRRFITQT
jgi:hypothetical protein